MRCKQWCSDSDTWRSQKQWEAAVDLNFGFGFGFVRYDRTLLEVGVLEYLEGSMERHHGMSWSVMEE